MMILKITNGDDVIKAISGDNELFTMAYADIKTLKQGDVLTLLDGDTILIEWDYLKKIELCEG